MFGTDGVRGRVGTEPITPATILHLGWAIGKTLRDSGERGSVLVGKDTRISGYMLESALEAGLSASGTNIVLLGPIPTPGIAYLTHTARAGAGIVISASHNAYHDNGIKIFASDGSKLKDTHIEKIDLLMQREMDCVPSGELGKASRLNDAQGRYVEFCKSAFDDQATLEGMKIVLDCANGAAYEVGPGVFSELGADLEVIGNAPDGFNINLECGSTHLTALKKKVLEAGADIGIALDGDADRVFLIDGRGAEVNGDQILYILACYRKQAGCLAGGVVGTTLSNIGLELAMKRSGIPFVRARVGDRFVHEELVSTGWDLGGEPSGHVIGLDKVKTGDGIIAALEVLEVMMKTGKTLEQLCTGITLYPQHTINVPTDTANMEDVFRHDLVVSAVERARQSLGNRGRVVLRPSGTEPCLRVMLEGDEPSRVQMLTEQIAETVKLAVSR